MSDFAFKMSSLDRKLAIGEMVSPADSDYDPEGEKFPDPLDDPTAAVQKYLQEYNSAKRKAEENPEEMSEVEGFHSCMMDFLRTCADDKLGPDDLPGTKMIIDLFGTDDGKNGISTFGSIEKTAIIPALIAAGAALAPKLLPMAQQGLKSLGLGQAMDAVGGLFGGGGDSGGQPAPQIQTTDYNMQPVSKNRFEMPYQHVTDNLMFEAATSPGPKKRNEDIETLRSQVVAALKAWADSGEAENKAEWWVYFSYAHEASTIAELQTILTAVPAEFHNAVMTNPLPVGEAPAPGESGLPDVTDPAEGGSSIATPSPVPIEGAGTPQKLPEGQGLIPGALSTHDKLKIKPIFSSTNESTFENYAEEDRQVLAKVAQFIQAGTHEEEIIETLHPAYGLEKTMWAVEEAKKVANNDPLVDPSVAHLGIEWKTANLDPYEEGKRWLMELDFSDFEDPQEQAQHIAQLNDAEVKHAVNSLYDGGWEGFLASSGFENDSRFPQEGEHEGANPDTAINQQETSGMITPSNEKVADYTAMPANTGMGALMPATGVPGQTTGVGLPPNPTGLLQTQKNQQQLDQLAKLYPNVQPEVAQQWLNSQKNVQKPNGHPAANAPNQTQPSSAGEKASPFAAGLPSATTAKAASWKDVNGNLLERGRLYKMTSPDYQVPDYVRVVNNGPNRLDIHFSDGGVDVSLNEEAMKTSKFKFEPMDEEKKESKWKKASSFLSESGLSTTQQRELIDERGVARNLDRLNLEGTHYPTLASFENDDTIEEDDVYSVEEWSDEDQDLFL